jgi:hypothetical protein
MCSQIKSHDSIGFKRKCETHFLHFELDCATSSCQCKFETKQKKIAGCFKRQIQYVLVMGYWRAIELSIICGISDIQIACGLHKCKLFAFSLVEV